jgi:hypothetical protein
MRGGQKLVFATGSFSHEMRNEVQSSKQKEKGQVKQKETWLKRARVFGKTSSRSNPLKK